MFWIHSRWAWEECLSRFSHVCASEFAHSCDHPSLSWWTCHGIVNTTYSIRPSDGHSHPAGPSPCCVLSWGCHPVALWKMKGNVTFKSLFSTLNSLSVTQSSVFLHFTFRPTRELSNSIKIADTTQKLIQLNFSLSCRAGKKLERGHVTQLMWVPHFAMSKQRSREVNPPPSPPWCTCILAGMVLPAQHPFHCDLLLWHTQQGLWKFMGRGSHFLVGTENQGWCQRRRSCWDKAQCRPLPTLTSSSHGEGKKTSKTQFNTPINLTGCWLFIQTSKNSNGQWEFLISQENCTLAKKEKGGHSRIRYY